MFIAYDWPSRINWSCMEREWTRLIGFIRTRIVRQVFEVSRNIFRALTSTAVNLWNSISFGVCVLANRQSPTVDTKWRHTVNRSNLMKFAWMMQLEIKIDRLASRRMNHFISPPIIATESIILMIENWLWPVTSF